MRILTCLNFGVNLPKKRLNENDHTIIRICENWGWADLTQEGTMVLGGGLIYAKFRYVGDAQRLSYLGIIAATTTPTKSLYE